MFWLANIIDVYVALCCSRHIDIKLCNRPYRYLYTISVMASFCVTVNSECTLKGKMWKQKNSTLLQCLKTAVYNAMDLQGTKKRFEK